MPAWSVLDHWFVPELADRFLVVRLGVAVVMLAWVGVALVARSLAGPRVGDRWGLLAGLGALCSAELSVAWMLPQVHEGLAVYLIGFSLGMIMSVTVLHWPTLVTVPHLAAVDAAAALTASTGSVPAKDAVATVFVVVTISLLCLVGQYLRDAASFGEFRARRDAEAARAEAEQQRADNLRLLAEVERLSREDPLTGLANRRVFDAEMLRTTLTAGNTPAALLMIDIDHFKRLNDEHGHLGGDEVLRVVGRCLREAVASVAGSAAASTPAAVAARYGGEEFALILADATWQDALREAEALRARISEGCRRAGFTVTASVGVGLYPDHGATPTTLVAAADAALYTAKASGRDRTVVAGTARADTDVVFSC